MGERSNENFILSWLEESGLDESFCLSNSDSDGPSECIEHNSDTEQSIDSGGENMLVDHPPIAHTSTSSSVPIPAQQQNQVSNQNLFYVGKDEFCKWLIHKPVVKPSKTAPQNIVTKLPGVKGHAKNCLSITDCWKVFCPDELIEALVTHTNAQLNSLRANYSRERDCLPTNYNEMLGLIGILYLLGVKKASHLNTAEIWKTDGTAPEFFRAVMSEKRFHLLIRCIRFDDKSTRSDRRKLDNLAPIRELFDSFVKRCYESYSPGVNVTLDEMLEAFRGKCKFRQYISNKPDKYGVKIYALVDSRTFYTLNMEIYAGKQPDGPFVVDNSVNSVVKRLIKPIDGTGRNVTMDNFYTNVPLANDLFMNHRTTIVGTIKKNKPQIPHCFREVKERKVGSSMFGFPYLPNSTLLLSHVPKKNKNVLMLSTLHKDDTIDPESPLDKPEVITFYNLTKGGVDVVDRMKKEYRVGRISNRWPLTIFNGLLNVAAINSQIIYKANTGNMMARRIFITELAKAIVQPHLLQRSAIEVLPTRLKASIQTVTGQNRPTTNNKTGKNLFYSKY